jgi:hypothetical protein
MGRHSIRQKTRDSEFDSLGVGVTLYFKLVKYLICLLCFVTLMTLPSFIFNCLGEARKPTDANIFYGLSITTLGNQGEVKHACSSLQNNTGSIVCSYGTLNTIHTVWRGNTTCEGLELNDVEVCEDDIISEEE